MLKTVRNFVKILVRIDALIFPGEVLEIRLIVGDRKNEPVACSETREIRIRERLFVRYVSRLRRLWGYSQKRTLIRLAIHEMRHKLQLGGTRLWTKKNIASIRPLIDERVFLFLREWPFFDTEDPMQIDSWIIEGLCMRLITRGRPLKSIKKVLLSQPKK